MQERPPNFRPDDETRALVESMFAQKKEVSPIHKVLKPKESQSPKENIRVPEKPKETLQDEAAALKLAMKEIDMIYSAFMGFCDELDETVIYGYLYKEVMNFMEACEDMESLLTGDIDEEKLTSHTADEYGKLSKIRKKLLSDVLLYYKK